MDASATRRSRRSCATSTTSPTASTCAATSSSTRASPTRRFDEAAGRWPIDTERRRAASRRRYCVMATGLPLGAQASRLPGPRATSRASGTTPARWPHEGVDFTGKRVGVDRHRLDRRSRRSRSIAEQAAHLTVFQRTPQLQRARAQRPARPGGRAPRSRPTTRERRRQARESTHRRARRSSPTQRPLEATERGARSASSRRAGSSGGLQPPAARSPTCSSDAEANEHARRVRARARSARSCSDPEVAELLLPRDYPLGTKRLCVDTGYYETYNRDNVTLVDLREHADRGDHAARACGPPTPSTSST